MGQSPARTCLAVVLAAGEGTRMQSSRPKVLHMLAGRSMLGHCVAAVAAAGVDRIALVVGPGRDDVAAEMQALVPHCAISVQVERRGTAHAVLAAEAAIADGYDDLLVVFADTPLVRPETFQTLRIALRDTGAAVVALGFEARDPTGYGRLLVNGTRLDAIREEKDATPDERNITLCNAGLMALDGRIALDLLRRIGTQNAQGEFYLTDVVALARSESLETAVAVAPEDEVLGVNDRVQLARAESLMQGRLREKAMRGGATLVDPSSVTLAFDTVLGRDVTIEPNVVFATGVQVADGVTIRAFSHLEGVEVGARATIGPFARLRPGSVLHEDVHVGNFVEIKASTLEAGVKANHLSYIGDASIGAKTNIGAGTITCNYNGFQKFRTQIGAGAFIGVNSALVAPVTIGDGAFIGTGSVVTEDVAADALVIARARQVEKPGWAKTFRDKNKR
ncbi:bifunctional UDP-N-acetylglucosamine diphosphorylase/glucosamine-1-phosphate N-acetyltransferase GlmU [Beijerinckia sp. L45]|uniref:bifunctional UDP-N-acetylglucosamine diphosphorylase/glucosamine-1-phosphate N-acetyltransferase GlmU n=1 Tax=Beijerinckia sp. L45 TaxID=1641855 RepID=UPI00131CF81E|nr:bifunctional UDP-N-acetylglucosamine diphosphorylase/glucosamine-1-phosphate N-acetyltransferase GlmU [Beijerinckia sp. L45]